MIKEKPVRVRFAPSPTGYMHLGNVRSALMNYIFAHYCQSHNYQATFILRIEDTDAERNINTLVDQIINDLHWLELTYDQGPYFQTKRAPIHTSYLEKLIKKNLVYRCFCTPEELEQKRQQQRAHKLPPRYDRTCLKLSSAQIAQNIRNNIPYIWRFQLDYDSSVMFYDLAHRQMTFELKHFSDIPLTRQDGSFTFIFANFVDDLTMDITHVLRGEDHLTNTALQVALYNALEAPIPIYWHLPILVNIAGKKLSKRDFGFSLQELRYSGYLPQAICNYLGIIGGSFKDEILSLAQLVDTYNFEAIKPTGQITYDLEKLKWINQQWISQLPLSELVGYVRPFLKQAYPSATQLTHKQLIALLQPVQPEMATLSDAVKLLAFYFIEPYIEQKTLEALNLSQHATIFNQLIEQYQVKDTALTGAELLQTLKQLIKMHEVKPKNIFMLSRLMLTGQTSGLRMNELFELLPSKTIIVRLKKHI